MYMTEQLIGCSRGASGASLPAYIMNLCIMLEHATNHRYYRLRKHIINIYVVYNIYELTGLGQLK